MNLEAQHEAIIALLQRAGVEVRETALGGRGGGLCEVGGKKILFIDLDADLATRLERSVQALAELPQLDSVFIPPVIRDLLDRYDAGSP